MISEEHLTYPSCLTYTNKPAVDSFVQDHDTEAEPKLGVKERLSDLVQFDVVIVDALTARSVLFWLHSGCERGNAQSGSFCQYQ